MMPRTKGLLLVSVFGLSACSSGADDADSNVDDLMGYGGGFAGSGTTGSGAGTAVGAGGSQFVSGAGGYTPPATSSGGAFNPSPGAGGMITNPPPPPVTGAGGGGDPFNPVPPGAGGAPPVFPPGAGGLPPGVAGAPAGAAGSPPQPPGDNSPVVPNVTADCPAFRNSTINFMGLGGIQIVAGAKAASPTAPMVFYWHGTASTSGEFAVMASAVQRGVVAEGGVLVSFQGTTGGDLLSGTLIFGAGDFELADQLFACAVRDHNVDPRRVFATGCSAGGLFSGAMAASRSNYIAAAAPNSGGWVLPVPFQNNYTPALMTIHGRPGGDVVIVDFSETSKTADTGFKGRGGFVINCNHGGGHCGGAGLAPSIWEFFKAHPYGTSPSPWTGGLPAGFDRSCQIL